MGCFVVEDEDTDWGAVLRSVFHASSRTLGHFVVQQRWSSGLWGELPCSVFHTSSRTLTGGNDATAGCGERFRVLCSTLQHWKKNMALACAQLCLGRVRREE